MREMFPKWANNLCLRYRFTRLRDCAPTPRLASRAKSRNLVKRYPRHKFFSFSFTRTAPRPERTFLSNAMTAHAFFEMLVRLQEGLLKCERSEATHIFVSRQGLTGIEGFSFLDPHWQVYCTLDLN